MPKNFPVANYTPSGRLGAWKLAKLVLSHRNVAAQDLFQLLLKFRE